MRKLLTVLTVISAIYAMPVQALRCNGKLINPGDDMQKVMDSCGEPDTTYFYDIMPEPIYYDHNHTHDAYCNHVIEYREPETVEVWIYNFGPAQFVRELHFKANRIFNITRHRYGD